MGMAQRGERQSDSSAIRAPIQDLSARRLALDGWFWLVVVLAAALRLWVLDSSQFLDDQSSLMLLAREAVLRHAVPIASIPSSLLTLNPPLSIYLLMPFALFGANPLPAIVALALWNILGVALCYAFAGRYFGRRVAVLAALIFAVSPAAVEYSRFLWQQNYLPPLVMLWVWVVYAGCIQGRRGMLTPAIALLTLGALLHATMLMLTPTLIVAILLAPRLPRWREWVYSLGALAVLLVPSIVWEALSGWSDLRILASYSAGRAKLDPEILFRLYQALGGPGLASSGATTPRPAPHSFAAAVSLLFVEPVTHPILGAGSPYAAAMPVYVAAALLAVLLLAAGWATLTWRTLAPALRLRAAVPAGSGWRARVGSWASAVWSGLRADAVWRTYLLLWLSVTVPLVALLRHSTALFTHYLIVLYPFLFITIALGVLSVGRGATSLASRVRVPSGGARLVGRVAACVLVALLIVVQMAQSALFTYSIATGRFDATAAGYGFPLSALLRADAILTELQRQTGAREIYIAERGRSLRAVDYVLVRGHAQRVGYPDDCLIVPPPSAAPSLIVVSADSTADRFLARLAGVEHVKEIAMAGNAPLVVYSLRGALPASLPGEVPLNGARFADGAGQGLQLDAAYVESTTTARLRFTVLGTTPPNAVPLTLHPQSREMTLDGHSQRLLAFRNCAPTRWEAGAVVFAWLPTPASWRVRDTPPTDLMLVQVTGETVALTEPALGPLHLLSSQEQSTPWLIASPLPSNHSGGGEIASGGVALTKALIER